MDSITEMENRQKWLDSLPDGVPCDHVGCLSHVSHPCEVCGRTAGRRTQRAADVAVCVCEKPLDDDGWRCIACGLLLPRNAAHANR